MEKRKRAKNGEPLRFFREALQTETDDCIIWPYGIGSHGYPDIRGALPDEVKTNGHRAVCVLAHGDRRSEGLEAEHLCGKSRRCINKRHLAWATDLENTQRKKEHGTQTRGENHSTAKFTQAQIDDIRASKEPARVLAERYSTHAQYIWEIRNKKVWADS